VVFKIDGAGSMAGMEVRGEAHALMQLVAGIVE